MSHRAPNPLKDLINELSKEKIETHTDITTRLLYATDASIYQIEPLGVVFPKRADELDLIVEKSASLGVPVLARGAGSSLAGQAVGAALILDCSRFLTRIIEIDKEQSSAIVEPGVILAALNKACASYNLQFGPDPASAERATIGGSIANNASGAHSILYGMTVDHVQSIDVVLSDGNATTFSEISIGEARTRAIRDDSYEANLYQAALKIRHDYRQIIQENWPRTWRRASGYNLNYLIPWSPTSPPLWNSGRSYPAITTGNINLAVLLAGSEGTLGVIKQATVDLVPIPKETILGVLAFSEISYACDATQAILEFQPSAVELIPQSLIYLARSVPFYAPLISFIDPLFIDGEPPALLVVEFSGEDLAQIREKVAALKGFGESFPVLIAETPDEQKRVWGVRKAGLGILASRPGDMKSMSFIEDISVPVEFLGEFVREMEHIFAKHNTQGDFYAHASAGCLHIRPLLNIKTARGVEQMRTIAQQAVDLAIHMEGSVSGEHGVGLARSEWLSKMYSDEIIQAFHSIKNAADPKGIMNPGKILDPPAMDMNLRYGSSYQAHPWRTSLDFSKQGGLTGAIELCNGAGVCRKADGVMCPSFQVLQDEMHSTRGRANLLRAMITGKFPNLESSEEAVFQALDLCLACKGCKSECPSAVDMAKLRYEFLNKYYQKQPRRLRDYLFAHIEFASRIGHKFRPVANQVLRLTKITGISDRLLGISTERNLPRFRGWTFSRRYANDRRLAGISYTDKQTQKCLFLSDAFTEYFNPDAGRAAIQVLSAAGYEPILLPVLGAGRTLISKGFLDRAFEHATKLRRAITRLDPDGSFPIVGVEPSEVYTLRDEYMDMFPNDEHTYQLASRTYMIDEFLVQPEKGGESPRMSALNFALPIGNPIVLLHGHCYQKAQPPAVNRYPTGVLATVSMLKEAGYQVGIIDSGCCGMAGAFGYESEHYELSMQIGELSLFPMIRDALIAKDRPTIAATGFSCQEQIKSGVGILPTAPIMLVASRL